MVKIKIFILFIIFFLFLFFYVFKPPAVVKFVNNLEDVKFSLKNLFGVYSEPFNDLVVVSVDEKSINEFGRWPWDRKITGELIKKLHYSKVVGLDIVFSEKSNKDSDKFLSDVIYQNGNVVSGFFFRDHATQQISDEIIDLLEDCSITRYKLKSEYVGLPEFYYIESNIPEILESSISCAFFNIKPDLDGIYRHYPTVFIFEGMLFPSLAVQLIKFYLDKEIILELDRFGIKKLQIGDINIRENYIRLNFYENVNSVSASDVLNGLIPEEFFKDKIVLIGITEMGVYDVRPTPVDPLMPGVFLHYTAVSNILNGDFIRSSKTFDILFTFAVLMVVFILSFIKKLKYRMPFHLIVLSIPFVIPLYFFIEEKLWLVTVYPFMFSFLYIIILEIVQYFRVDSQTRELKYAFSKYLSPDIVEQIVKNPEKLGLGGEEKEITVLFADIRNFTAITEKLNSHEIAKLLNIYFDGMTEVVLKNKGLLDKYIGDAVMAVFNAPINLPDHPDKGCETALEMIKKLSNINKKLKKENLPQINIGIGINTGSAVIGNLGSSIRFEYTAVGDTVNLASRLESLNRIYGTDIIVSEFTVNKCKKKFLFRKLDKVIVKGKELPVEIYELMEYNKRNLELKSLYEQALKYYFNTEFEKAMEIFKELKEKFNDKPSEILYQRCMNFCKNPPDVSWDGVYEFYEK
ncbi:CHASE2 domain-containing protein [Persephonella sp.]